MDIFHQIESNVRRYCRDFPAVFASAKGAILTDTQNKSYIDFLSCGGALNYGHNDPCLKQAVCDYLAGDGVIHALDLHTVAKAEFLAAFNELILQPRQLDFKVQFTGPTGANGIEAALKLARLIKQRSNIIAFTNSFHGLSLGALAVTASRSYRKEAYLSRQNVSFLPFDGYLGSSVDTIDYLRKVILDPGSGVDLPAAVLVETVQAEGGVNLASWEWLRALALLCQDNDILLIVDEVQTGVGRTGPFFSFETAGIVPDIVVMSKSLSGLGLPLTVLLMKPELDQWQPGEHTGTFRGNNLALVAATAAMRHYWHDRSLEKSTEQRNSRLRERLAQIQSEAPDQIVAVRGRGMLHGLQVHARIDLKVVIQSCFVKGLLVETCGPNNDVLKIAPPLTTSDELLEEGLKLLTETLTGSF